MRARAWQLWRRLEDRRARMVAWVTFGAVVVAGMWRVEDTANDAQANAADVRELVDRLEEERVDRCREGRGDTRRAIVRVVDEFTDLTAAELVRLGEVVDDEIPTVACTRPPP